MAVPTRFSLGKGSIWGRDSVKLFTLVSILSTRSLSVFCDVDDPELWIVMLSPSASLRTTPFGFAQDKLRRHPAGLALTHFHGVLRLRFVSLDSAQNDKLHLNAEASCQ